VNQIFKEGEGDMVRKFASRLSAVACAACLSLLVAGRAAAVDPPYQIILRSRNAVVTPERTRDSQTGGGYIQVTQVEPNAIMVLMRGAVAAGSGHKDNSAAMQFTLDQDFEIVPTKAGRRPPRLILSAWLIGSLTSTLQEGGTADHAPACATVQSGGQPILNLCIHPHSVAGGQDLLVNDRGGPLELCAAPGGYCLHQTFAISANQPKGYCHPGSAAADFDPDPKLDTRWNEVLKPFRAVPHRDFGFRVILQVVEEPPLPPVGPAPDPLPPPNPVDKNGPAAAGKPAKP
jgi:hypothetical protein